MQVYYRHKGEGYAPFLKKMEGRRVTVVSDLHTDPFAREIISMMNTEKTVRVCFPLEELVPDETVYETIYEQAADSDYILAVGSGSLNDSCKFAGIRRGIPTGCLATAASMDGYLSGGAPVIEQGRKITETAVPPEDILVDPAIVCHAPKDMTASGFGDIIGKYTCLTDWELAHILKGEPIHQEAYDMMKEVRDRLVASFEDLTSYSADAVSTLMEALLTAGISMAICGNSRPASGSEHHMSHFLEMDFIRRGEKIPLHGVKVAIGTMISIELYRHLAETKAEVPHREELKALADRLPTVEAVKTMLVRMGCPVRFSKIGVREETMRAMLHNAYTVRDRYTVLTLYHELGIMNEMEEYLVENYF